MSKVLSVEGHSVYFSVSETIRKAPLAEANCIRKTESITPVFVPLPKFSEKLLPRTQFTEIEQSAGELWPKQFLIWQPSAILNFLGPIMGSLKTP